MHQPESQTHIAATDLAAARAPLEEAAPLPPGLYTSAAVYSAEVEHIFRREWICVGRADQVPERGNYLSLELFDEPLMLVRGDDYNVRVLSRVCRHRAAEVASGAGKTGAFRCPYHAWTYRLDGSLHAAPLMDGARRFDVARCGLREFRTAAWEGWVFVNLDGNAEPLEPQLAPLSTMLANYRMADMVATEPLEFDSPFNWKILVDNFMEAYHHIAIHRTTFEPNFPAAQSNVPDNTGPYSVLQMPVRENADLSAVLPALPPHGPLTDSERARLVAAAVFPVHLFAPAGESLVWYHILPTSHEHFTLRIHVCVPRATLDNPACAADIAALRDFVSHIHHEDIGACEAVWRGIRAPSAVAGRLSPLERSLWQFNQWWLSHMDGAV